jgi:O-methyltransferase involved in polyketide biosynthesis
MLYERISTTGDVIAHIRSFTSLQYAKEIARLANSRERTHQFHHRPDFDIDLDGMQKLSPWIELRSRAIARVAKRISKVGNYLELASGLSPMGLNFTKDPNVFYLETDLSEVIAEKQHIALSLGLMRENLGFKPASALDESALRNAVEEYYKDSWWLTVLCEGLLQYLTHDEKRTLANIVSKLLHERDGVWVTTDVLFKDDQRKGFDQNLKTRRIREIMRENTGRDMVELAFDGPEQAKAFFLKSNLTVEIYPQFEGSECTSPHLQKQQVWVLKPIA